MNMEFKRKLPTLHEIKEIRGVCADKKENQRRT